MPILLPQWHRVVAIPRIEDCLSGVVWNSSCLVEGGGAVVGLPGGVGVQGLEVYSPPQGPVLLGAYHHPVAPSYWGPQGDLFQHPQGDVSVLTSSCQCTGTGIGLWQGLVGSIERAKGGLVIIGRVWCSHALNELEEYRLSRYSSILCLFASVAGNGSDVGLAGGWDLVGQEHDLVGMAIGSAGSFWRPARRRWLLPGGPWSGCSRWWLSAGPPGSCLAPDPGG